MRVIDTLITDRSQSDVGQNDKGSYNASDLNRVGAACAYLYDMFAGCGYAVPGYVALPTDWAVTGVPTAGDMNTYLGTIAALKAVLQAAQEIPDSMEKLTVDGANDIERLLIEVEDQVKRLSAVFIHAGMPWAVSGLGYSYYIQN